eukprot:scaffold66283_cov22-Tisochrysis_lutea.AAC.2
MTAEPLTNKITNSRSEAGTLKNPPVDRSSRPDARLAVTAEERGGVLGARRFRTAAKAAAPAPRLCPAACAHALSADSTGVLSGKVHGPASLWASTPDPFHAEASCCCNSSA